MILEGVTVCVVFRRNLFRQVVVIPIRTASTCAKLSRFILSFLHVAIMVEL